MDLWPEQPTKNGILDPRHRHLPAGNCPSGPETYLLAWGNGGEISEDEDGGEKSADSGVDREGSGGMGRGCEGWEEQERQ